MTADLERCHNEQRRCATLLLAGHPERDGLMLGLWDWHMEEVLILTERPGTPHTDKDGGLRNPASE